MNLRFAICDLRLKTDAAQAVRIRFRPPTPAGSDTAPSAIANRKSQIANRGPLATGNRQLATRAFTLIEVLIVMGIIVLLIALALPSFNFITGARSIEASTNQLGAILGIARQDAIGIQEDRGVVVFHDARTGKDAIGECELRTFPFADYVAGSTGPVTPVNYVQGQYAMYNNKAYVCILPYADLGPTGTPASQPPNSNTTNWRELQSATTGAYKLLSGDQVLELRFDREYQTLPVGISIRGVGNEITYRDAGGANVITRYFNPSVCFFDSTGQVVLRNFFVLYEGMLAERMGAVANQLTDDPPQPASTFNNACPLGKNLVPATASLQSQIGFVSYDTETFKNVASGYTPSGRDAWLDQNAAPVMVNRYNGTLVKGE